MGGLKIEKAGKDIGRKARIHKCDSFDTRRMSIKGGECVGTEAIGV